MRVTEDTLGVISSALVEAVHVELADEGVHFVVPEVARQDDGLELVDVLDDELGARWCPEGYLGELFILDKQTLTFSISKVLAMNPAI